MRCRFDRLKALSKPKGSERLAAVRLTFEMLKTFFFRATRSPSRRNLSLFR